MLNSKRMMNNFDDSVNLFKRDPKVPIKINVMLDRYKRLSYNYQSEIRDHSYLISSIVLKRVIYLF